MGNMAEKCCFGINQDKTLKFFMKVHLVLAISDAKAFIPPLNKNVQTPLNDPTVDQGESEEEDNPEDSFVNVWDDDPIYL